MKAQRRVHFAMYPVTGVSCSATVAEYEAMLDLEIHTRKCFRCRGGRLSACRNGSAFARELTRHLIGGGNGLAYSTKTPGVNYYRIELPARFSSSAGLLGVHELPNGKRPRGILKRRIAMR